MWSWVSGTWASSGGVIWALVGPSAALDSSLSDLRARAEARQPCLHRNYSEPAGLLQMLQPWMWSVSSVRLSHWSGLLAELGGRVSFAKHGCVAQHGVPFQYGRSTLRWQSLLESHSTIPLGAECRSLDSAIAKPLSSKGWVDLGSIGSKEVAQR